MKFPFVAAALIVGTIMLAQSAPVPASSSAPAPASAPESGSAPAAAAASAPASAPAPVTAPVSAPVTGPLEFTDVVQVEGASAAELYIRAKMWFAQAFVDSKHVLEVEDKDAGMLVGKGNVTYTPSMSSGSGVIRGKIDFTVKIMVKDGRYKYSIFNFKHSGSPYAYMGSIFPSKDFGLITDESEPDVDRGSIGKSWRIKVWQELKQISKAEAEKMADSLKKRMAQPSKGTDNW